MNIRLAQKTDLNSIQKVVESAFSDEENKAIMDFVADLSSETSSPPIKSLVAEVENDVIGYVSYSPIFLGLESKITGYILAPLAVMPNRQKKGVGSNLINQGKQMLSRDGVDVLLVYGDPAYYGRFGFKAETARILVPPYPLTYPFGWSGVVLSQSDIGREPLKFDCVKSLRKPELW